MTNSLKKILLRRKNLVEVNATNPNYEQSDCEKALLISMLKNVQSLGFTFSKELFEVLCHYDRAELEKFYLELIPMLKELVGADVQYNPMYPNFPQQVMEASDAELFINAIIHYWSFGNLMPQYEKNERLPLIDDNKMSILSIGGEDNIAEIFANLVASKTSLSVQDKDDIRKIVFDFSDYAKYLPDEIPLKENVAFISKLIIEEVPTGSVKDIKKYFKTATDVLRLIVALSDGDISLATRTKFRSLKRKERRMVMNLLAGCGDITEDLFRYQYEWIRVGEILHPFEYAYPKYKSVNRAFNILRNGHKPLMFAGKVQKAILSGQIQTAANLLKQRPGDFARQLDKLIRENIHDNYVVECFREVAEKVSSPVLLQVRQHFIGRVGEPDPVRVFFPKGNLAKAIVIPNELPTIPNSLCQQIIDICNAALVTQYKEKESMGKVFIDEDFENYLVPFSQRSASKATKTIVRGSQLPIRQNAKIVRPFIWWTNPDDFTRLDIDLSAVFYNENWGYMEHISYTNLRSYKFNAAHSGDITDGGNPDGDGVAEFIDIDINQALANGCRYVAFQIYSYSNISFCNLPNCRFGWMEREDANSGEIFEPKTVEQKMDLSADSKVAIPAIFDCKERRFIWCDMNLAISNYGRGGNNLESNLEGVTATCYGIAHLNKPSLYELIYLNAYARGEIVKDRNEADIIFSNDKTVPYEIVAVTDEATGLSHREVKDKSNVPIITSYDFDYYVGKLL